MSLHEELSQITTCAIETDDGWELWENGVIIGDADAARNWAWRMSPGRLAVLHDPSGRAVAFDRAETVGALWPDAVESLTGQRMDWPVV